MDGEVGKIDDEGAFLDACGKMGRVADGRFVVRHYGGDAGILSAMTSVWYLLDNDCVDGAHEELSRAVKQALSRITQCDTKG